MGFGFSRACGKHAGDEKILQCQGLATDRAVPFARVCQGLFLGVAVRAAEDVHHAVAAAGENCGVDASTAPEWGAADRALAGPGNR